jgi:hypothetical protein
MKTMENNKTTTMTNFRDSGIENDPKLGSIDQASNLLDSTTGKPIAKQSFTSNMPNNRQQTPKALLYYPEECHMPSIAECKDWNARLMKHMISQKMAKNQTY